MFNNRKRHCKIGKDVLKKEIQGQPLGFDTKYQALGDRNMQVGFILKVFWES